MRQFFLFTTVLLFFSCSGGSGKFDKDLWQKQSDKPNTYRESMIKDLIENKLLEGVSYQEIVRLLGEPDSKATYKEQFTLNYDISKTENSNQEPARIKSLIITFGSDSLVGGFNVEELKFK